MNKKGLIPFLCLLFLISCQRSESPNASFKQPLFVWGFSIEGFPLSNNVLEKLEQEIKIAPQIIQFYLQWPVSLERFESIRPSLEAIASQGAIPCMTWEPMTTMNKTETMIPFEDILNGQYDDYLIQMAQDIKGWNQPLIIRLAHEMNLNRYHWGGTLDQFNSDSPKQYIQMFRYIVNLFHTHGLENVLWAFCPNVDSVPNQPWNTPRHYYPGDEYVDLLGMDGYNWDITEEMAKERKQTWAKPWISFQELFGHLYQDLKTIAPHKPILVFETASVDRKGEQKSKWIKEAIETAKKWNLLGIIWFQIHKEEDWRINQNNDAAYIPIIRLATNPLKGWIEHDLNEKNASHK